MRKWFQKKGREEHYEPILQEDEEERQLEQEARQAEEERRRRLLEAAIAKPEEQAPVDLPREQNEDDAFTEAQTAAKDIFTRLLRAAQNPVQGVNCMTLLLFSSGLAGYAAQAAAREDQQSSEQPLFSRVRKQGRVYLFGEALNHYLETGENSLYNITKGVFERRHPNQLLPPYEETENEILDLTAAENPSYHGVKNPGQYMRHYRLMWEHERPTLEHACRSYREWPLVYNIVLQYALGFAVRAMDPLEAAEFSLQNAAYAAHLEEAAV